MRQESLASAGGVSEARLEVLQAGGGATPTSALINCTPKDINVSPIPHQLAKTLCEHEHYLGTFPGGSVMSLGVFVQHRLLGIAVLGVGPPNVHRLFQGARREQVLCLTRFWLHDQLPRNSESRTLSVILRHFRRHQSTVKAIVAYSDPAAGHTGTIYRAAGFYYLGPSDSTPLYRLPDGSVHHGRTLGSRLGTRSRTYLAAHNVPVAVVSQQPKHIYVALLDKTWRSRCEFQFHSAQSSHNHKF